MPLDPGGRAAVFRRPEDGVVLRDEVFRAATRRAGQATGHLWGPGAPHSSRRSFFPLPVGKDFLTMGADHK